MKGLLKNKDLIPTEIMLERVLGERFIRYQNILSKLLRRKLSPEMYWYGPSSGWAPRFCIGEITVCGIYLAQNPLMGLIGIGDRISDYLDRDVKLDPRSRVLYKISPQKGPLKWVEIQLATDSDVDIFLSLIDGKLRALLKLGISLRLPTKKNIKKIKLCNAGIRQVNLGSKEKNNSSGLEGLSAYYNVRSILIAGRG